MEKDASAFAEVAVEKGMLTPGQRDECVAAYEQISGHGVTLSFGSLCRQKGYLTRAQIAEVRQELRKRGILPRLGEYEIIEKVGSGGGGSVYRAWQKSRGRTVAIKVLSASLARDRRTLERFKREAELTLRLDHPNIVKTYEVGEVNGYHFIAMEYVEGIPVSNMIANGPLDEQQALRIVRDIAEALRAAHEVGIVHRDVKPSNIMITRSHAAKLTDLGLSKSLRDESRGLTSSDDIIGTPLYMSPEQFDSSRQVDERSDIYSLGATFYHMLTGRVPFDGQSVLELVRAQDAAERVDPRNVNPKVSYEAAALCRRMMAKSPAGRHRNAAALIEEMDRITPTTGVAPADSTVMLRPRAAEPAKPAPPARRREWLLIALAPVAVLLTVAGLLLFNFRNARESAAPRPPETAQPGTVNLPEREPIVSAPVLPARPERESGPPEPENEPETRPAVHESAPEQPVPQPPQKSVADLIRERMQKPVRIHPPYNELSRHGHADKISVQFAVAAILEQAGVEFDRMESLRRGGAACRRWIRPDLRGESCEESLDRLLGEVNLGWELHDGKVVLVPK